MLSPYLMKLLQRASQNKKTIVLPEGEDERVLEAAYLAIQSDAVHPIVLGNIDQMKSFYKRKGWNDEKIEMIDPSLSPRLKEYTDLLFKLRQSKGMTEEEAAKTALIPTFFATLMVKSGHADGMTSGACHSTADTVRPALQIIKSKDPSMSVSAFFLMVSQGEPYILADSGLIINPTVKELADIAVTSAISAIQFGIEPNVALLSYSTKGSAKGDSAAKVIEATQMALETLKTEPYKNLGIKLDGELQADAALVESVASRKAPGSVVGGKAKVLVVPNLDAGNISYKLLQRLGGCEAYGPILQGLNAPVNDLSRGASAEDILGAMAITAIQAQH